MKSIVRHLKMNSIQCRFYGCSFSHAFEFFARCLQVSCDTFQALFQRGQWIVAAVFLVSNLLHSFEALALSDTEILTAAQKSQSVEDFLNHLSPEVRSQYTLIYKGQGLQGSSAQSPRVLFFDPEGANYLTLTSEAKLAGGKSVEWLSYSSAHGFKFKEILFYPSAASIKNTAQTFEKFVRDNGLNKKDLDEKSGALIFSNSVVTAANPSKCMSCHQSLSSVVHPLWNSYPHWPGVIGSLDDQIFSFRPSDEEGVHMPWSQFGSKVDRSSPHNEFLLFENYKKQSLKNSRLGALTDWNSPYERKGFKDFEGEPDFEAQARNLSPLVNTRLTTLMMVSFAEQLALKWIKTPQFQKNSPLIFYGAYCNSSVLRSLVSQKLMPQYSGLMNEMSTGKRLIGEDRYVARKFVKDFLVDLGVSSYPQEIHFDQSLPSGDTGVNSGIETTELFASSQNYISGWLLALAFKQSKFIQTLSPSGAYGPYSSFVERYDSQLSKPAQLFLKKLDQWSDFFDFDRVQDELCPKLSTLMKSKPSVQ